MAASARSDVELLTEHFGYPPVSLLDDIINSINILAERALNSVEQGLLNAPPASLGFRPPTHSTSTTDDGCSSSSNLPNAAEAHRHEIEAGTHQLETLLCASIDKNFDVLELYVMRNILCVRPEDRDWIRLSHYEGLDFSNFNLNTSNENDNNVLTVEGVNNLRRRLQASQKLNTMLQAEKARNGALLRDVRRLVGAPQSVVKQEAGVEHEGQQQEEGGGDNPDVNAVRPFGFLHSTRALADGGAETPLTTTTAFTLSQLQALRALSTSLRNLMPDLAARRKDGEDEDEDEEGAGGRKKSWRRERVEYVETATKKHLENVRGLELGKDGEVRDGEWHGEDRGLAMDEVEGLERAVAVLGGGGSENGSGGTEGEEMDES
ncbi:Mis12 protein-domain-containing protein [Cercophora scortea]|uniref:Mis12 protein-domain-containing protein n=1 Tax=Cercophora scortea TaxID=314031 RepID=A0AAE0MHK6_9PEZI|nr:Mis12 protein-domain-containing protein [Cercophora scortea]